jgi:hypothetical protein
MGKWWPQLRERLLLRDADCFAAFSTRYNSGVLEKLAGHSEAQIEASSGGLHTHGRNLHSSHRSSTSSEPRGLDSNRKLAFPAVNAGERLEKDW